LPVFDAGVRPERQARRHSGRAEFQAIVTQSA
jgi:hypothetical protein